MPIEIRLTQDKLSLVSRLLSSNTDAYQHPEVILDLVAKLGYRGDALAEARVLSMLGDAAIQACDAKRAADICDRMIAVVQQIRKGRDQEKAAYAAELAWKTCYQFGKTTDSDNNARKKEVLGQALLLCPPTNISEVLGVWHVCDTSSTHNNRLSPRKRVYQAGDFTKSETEVPLPGTPDLSTVAPISLPHPAESAARAALAVGRAATAYLPFRSATPDTPSSRSASPRGKRQHEFNIPQSRSPAISSDVVKDEFSKRFTAGVSWLL